MKLIQLLAAFTFSLLLLTIPLDISANVEPEKDLPETEVDRFISSFKVDKKALILAKYLESYNSPMQYYAQDFIDASEHYNIDWRLLPSIAGVESTFGKRIPGGYNAYGWGVYGENVLFFKSWRDGMFTVAKGLKENYINKGLTNPYAMNRIYATSPSWGYKVSYFMIDLEKFFHKHTGGNMSYTIVPPSDNAAAQSGKSVLKGI